MLSDKYIIGKTIGVGGLSVVFTLERIESLKKL
jgi:hypothetical protein